MALVKRTGEVTEVSLEVMRLLRAEEKRLCREREGVPIAGAKKKKAPILSLDYSRTGNSHENYRKEESNWLIDRHDFVNDLETRWAEESLIKDLTKAQLDVYINCIKCGQKRSDYAKEHDISRQSVDGRVKGIQKKNKKIFLRYLLFVQKMSV